MPGDENLIGRDKFEKIFKELSRSGKQFEDLDFPANDKSLYENANSYKKYDWKTYVWRRPEEIFKGPYDMFCKTKDLMTSRIGIGKFIEASDIKQGGLGNCYFLSALSVIAEKNPLKILDLFITRRIN